MTPSGAGGDWSHLKKKDPEADRVRTERLSRARASNEAAAARKQMQSDLERLRFFVWNNCDPCEFPEVPALLDGWEPPE